MKYSIRKIPYGVRMYALVVQRSIDHCSKEPLDILGIETQNFINRYTTINVARLSLWLSIGATCETRGIKNTVNRLVYSKLIHK